MTQVMACIDGSTQASAVCDCAVWASQRLGSPLSLLHVLDQQRYPLSGDFSGIIGLGSREFLLEERHLAGEIVGFLLPTCGS